MIRKYFCYLNVSQRIGSSISEIFENNGGEFLSFSSTTFCTQERERERERKGDGRREKERQKMI